MGTLPVPCLHSTRTTDIKTLQRPRARALCNFIIFVDTNRRARRGRRRCQLATCKENPIRPSPHLFLAASRRTLDACPCLARERLCAAWKPSSRAFVGDPRPPVRSVQTWQIWQVYGACPFARDVSFRPFPVRRGPRVPRARHGGCWRVRPVLLRKARGGEGRFGHPGDRVLPKRGRVRVGGSEPVRVQRAVELDERGRRERGVPSKSR